MKQNRTIIENRRARMLNMIREQREISVDALARTFGVSPMTIRRDLRQMELQGAVNRFYGGATVMHRPTVLPGGGIDEVTVYRDLIARYAATCIRPGDRIFINGSLTALNTLSYITAENVRVFTNNGAAIGMKRPAGVSVVLSGGDVRNAGGILTGDCAMRNLLMETADAALIGCAGISPNGEVLCGIPTELGINESMIAHAGRYYILADHTKIGRTGLYASCSLEKRGTVITDELAPPDAVERLRAVGMEVIMVKKSDFTEGQG